MPGWTRSLLGVLAVAGILLGGTTCYDRHVASDALLHAALTASEQRADSLARRAVELDTIYVTDTLTLRETETRYVTLRDTVLAHLTDTVVHVDTVRMLIARADSTIHACRITVLDCERRADTEQALRLERESEIRILKASRPRFGLKTGLVLGILGTVSAVYLAGRLD